PPPRPRPALPRTPARPPRGGAAGVRARPRVPSVCDPRPRWSGTPRRAAPVPAGAPDRDGDLLPHAAAPAAGAGRLCAARRLARGRARRRGSAGAAHVPRTDGRGSDPCGRCRRRPLLAYNCSLTPMAMMNRMIVANLRRRPVRSLVSIMAVAIEVTLILMIVGLT